MLRGFYGRRMAVLGSSRWKASLKLTVIIAIQFIFTMSSFADSCILVDSDADLDDFRAVLTLAPTERVVAIVTTEGISRAREGAGAMESLLKFAGSEIPVIVGATRNSERVYTADRDFQKWRNSAERLNGLLEEPKNPSVSTDGDFVRQITDVTRKCPSISLLVIGPWTSFLRYASETLPKIDRITAQGRPYPDELGGEPAGFNCVYDINSCLTAFDLLVGRRLRADRKLQISWVDIPNGLERCGTAEPGVDENGKRPFAFSPTDQWISELRRAGGGAAIVADMLDKDHGSWKRTSLWDDLTALFLLRPDIFKTRGGHYEPCVPSAAVRNILTEAMSAHR